jgi:serine/threonine-protein kinase
MIGTGGMADVYSAHDGRLNRDVAIKILRSDLARDPAFVARFRKEALAAAGLNHPGIVAVYDSGEDGTDSYIVMELVKGHTLRELLQEHTSIDPDTALKLTAGILEALEYSHSQGIIHRDIKPGNIMITTDGEIKVMDFGIARALADIGATMTNTWNVVGTAQYLSPEQATGETADARSDIYSVGCVLYELLSGQAPFTGDTPVSIAFQHVSGELVPLTQRAPGVDPALGTICAVALSKDPAHRYQSAYAMLTDLLLSRGRRP